MDRDRDVVAVACKRLVDRVIQDLEHHVMQAGAVARVADIHPGTLAHGFQPFEHLDAAGAVFVRCLRLVGLEVTVAVGAAVLFGSSFVFLTH